MNLFWQITLIEFLLNVAVFAGAIVLYGPIRTLAASFSGGREVIQQAASGVLFGIATTLAILLPVHLEGGAAVGCSTILLAIAGPRVPGQAYEVDNTRMVQCKSGILQLESRLMRGFCLWRSMVPSQDCRIGRS